MGYPTTERMDPKKLMFLLKSHSKTKESRGPDANHNRELTPWREMSHGSDNLADHLTEGTGARKAGMGQSIARPGPHVAKHTSCPLFEPKPQIRIIKMDLEEVGSDLFIPLAAVVTVNQLSLLCL